MALSCWSLTGCATLAAGTPHQSRIDCINKASGSWYGNSTRHRVR